MSRQAADQMYEALFLNGFTAFEAFIEEVFIYLLIAPQRGSSRSNVVPRVTIRSHTTARQLVIGPRRKYVDWLPYEQTIARAEIFFRAGRPFSDIGQAQRDVMNNAQVIRNAIAHRSRHSEEKFHKHVIGNIPLPPRERHPGGFLRGLSGAPLISRFENYANTLQTVAKSIT